MPKSSFTRLLPFLVVAAICMVVPAPSYASCSGESSNVFYEYCRTNGGVFSFQEYGLCADDDWYIRNYGMCHCTYDGAYVESTLCYAG
jgi:hypothetical protein